MRLSGSLAIAAPLAFLAFVAALEDVGDQPRKLERTITWEKGSPDGNQRYMAFINGQFPGAMLEMNQGDNVEITFHNKMPYNTTVHFHGINQYGTPWSDGVPGLTQRYIQPNNSFTYKWTASQFGSFWYHAHYRGQIDDGVYGAILIHPKSSTPDSLGLIAQNNNDTLTEMRKAVANVKPIVLSDWRHNASADVWKVNVASGMDNPCYDSILINGRGAVTCWSRSKIDQLTTVPQRNFLRSAGEQQLTDKGCLPARAQALTFSKSYPTNTTGIPNTYYDKCTPTTGRMAVVPAKQGANGNGNWQAFDVIGTFGMVTGIFSIDQHQMYVYAVDGSYIQPQLVEAISIANGDRYSVLIKTDRTGDFGIRVASAALPQIMSGIATLRVGSSTSTDDADSVTATYITPDEPANPPSKVRRQRQTPSPSPTASSTPTSTPYINDAGVAAAQGVTFFSEAGQRQYPADPPAQRVDRTYILDMAQDKHSYQWAINRTIYPLVADDAEPLLFQPVPNRHDDVTITTNNNTWVDLVFVSSIYPMPPHPVHKHGTHMWLLGSGQGNFTWRTVAEAAQAQPNSFNFNNPPRRDSFQSLPAIGGPVWLAVRYHSTDPGPWMLHCHIQTHLEGGMAMVIQDGIDTWPKVPAEYLNMA